MLPEANTTWPPQVAQPALAHIAELSAWYAGDPEQLRRQYEGRSARSTPSHSSQYAGGVAGALGRFWWGRPLDPGMSTAQRVDSLHVPIASDVAQLSSDLLYGEAPSLSSQDTTTGDWLSSLSDSESEESIWSPLSDGAEIGAALGGRYHRITWDQSISRGAFVTTVDPDQVIPEFRWGRLVAATVWHVTRTEGQTYWRHLERHELDGQGNGVVLHGLYRGSPTSLGMAVPLADDPATRDLAGSVDADQRLIGPLTPGLLIVHVPNISPARSLRTDAIGRYLGRADVEGVTHVMDALDETYSSWLRDIRLAKSRIFVPDYMLQSQGAGKGAAFDLDRDLYVPLRVAAPEDGNAQLTLSQFSIRVEEHIRTAQELTEVIIRSAGYSSASLGENEDGGAVTATEVRSRERRSYSTRDRKLRQEKPAVARLLRKLASVDVVLTGLALDPGAIDISWPDGVQDTLDQLAQTTLMLDQAAAASIETKVRLLHSDWSPDRIAAEVAAIQAERGSIVPSALV